MLSFGLCLNELFMKQSPSCQCSSSCQTKRCPCVKSGHVCNEQCQCQNCKNPFNQREYLEQFNHCARAHLKIVSELSDVRLKKQYKLPCGCGRASLQDLLGEYGCHGCDEVYYYSFCLNEVVDDNSMWHCDDCGTCREDSEWHCKHCNTCTWGVTLECENCGSESPFMPRGL